MKKLVAKATLASFVFSVGFFVPQWNSAFSYSNNHYQQLASARDLAYQYLQNSLNDPDWKWKNPYINGEKFFYTTGDTPAYIEFKISSNANEDNGFILVNIDGSDVSIPMASPSGKTPSEALKWQLLDATNTGDRSSSLTNKNTKFYYFSPFDQWIENTTTGDVMTLDPSISVSHIVPWENTDRDTNEWKIIYTEQEKLKKRFTKMKEEVDKFPETSSQDKSWFWLSFSTSDVLLPWKSTSECAGPLPCYNQFRRIIGDEFCLSWCVPTAFAIVLWYLDLHGHPHLIPWDAPKTRDWRLQSIIRKLWDIMNIECIINNPEEVPEWGVSPKNITNVVWYLQSLFPWYKSVSLISTEQNTPALPEEKYKISSFIQHTINSWRPTILVIKYIKNLKSWHAIVISGYNSKNPQIVRANFGWGNIKTSWWLFSNLDINLDSIKVENTEWLPYIAYDIYPKK